MILLICVVLALIPLLGVVWILAFSSVTTVDGLFMSLILLAMSGILWLNVVQNILSARAGSLSASALASGGTIQRGRVRSVDFFEAHVGQPNKSIVMLGDGAKAPRMLVFEGDMRNALPVGLKVEITFRKESGANVLMNVNYA
jgi:hypothetical protein